MDCLLQIHGYRQPTNSNFSISVRSLSLWVKEKKERKERKKERKKKRKKESKPTKWFSKLSKHPTQPSMQHQQKQTSFRLLTALLTKQGEAAQIAGGCHD
jgi:hypothetical protein